jgi:hypothetical protein
MEKKMKETQNEEISSSPIISMTYESFLLCNHVIDIVLAYEEDEDTHCVPIPRAFDILLAAMTEKSENAENLLLVTKDVYQNRVGFTMKMNWENDVAHAEYFPIHNFDTCLAETKRHKQSVFLIDKEQRINIQRQYVALAQFVEGDAINVGSIIGALICALEIYDKKAFKSRKWLALSAKD